MTITPFTVLSPGRPELPFVTVIFMRPVLWRLAVFGGQETEHVKYTPPEIRRTSNRVTVRSVCCDKHSDYSDLMHTQRWLAVYYICVFFKPVVNLCPGRSVGVDGRFIGFVWFVKAEAVVVTVSGAVELLEQEDHGLMDNSQHSQPVNTCNG